MGQYFSALLVDADGNTDVIRGIAGETGSAKLMEHSWWLNRFVNGVAALLASSPKKVAWVGDYADDVGFDEALFKKAYGKDAEWRRLAPKKDHPTLEGRFLANHTKKEYIDCDAYFKRSVNGDGWCIHPLPLMTCVGNGQGCGDYYSETGSEFVGTWCMDSISVEDKVPEGYTLIEPMFREDNRSIRKEKKDGFDGT